MDTRLGLVESDLRDLRKDIRQLVYFVIGGVIVLLGMMATGYVRLDDKVDSKVNALEARMNTRFDKVDARMDKIEDRLGKIEIRLEKQDTKLDTILERLPKK
ncbi:MAG: hypothetical protein FD177_249 [Desulfovibrionaceae bacterium]|nr:MAG: hypothetical protein FD177_249 [Desulfovibrionaceae bacterium]